MLISGMGGKVHLCDAQGGQEVRTLEGHTDQVRGLAFAPNGRLAVSGGDDTQVIFWDLETGQEARRISGHHKDAVTSVAFAPNGRWVLSGSSDKSARLWDAQTGKELRRFEGHGNWVNGVAFSPAQMQIATCSGGDIVDGKFVDGADTTVRVWDAKTERELYRFAQHAASVTGVAFAPSGRLLVSGGLDKTVRLLLLPNPG